MTRASVLCALLLAVLALPVTAASPMRFSRLGGDEALSQGGVMAILQDSQGFLWLGTEDGLDRYDGYELRRLAHDANKSGGLPANWISALAEDSGALWIGTDGGGVARYNLATGAFENLDFNGAKAAPSRQENIKALRLDRRGQLWVGTRDNGLFMIDRAHGAVKHFRHALDDVATLSSDSITALAEDHYGTIWIGSRNGLDRLDPTTGRIDRQSLIVKELTAAGHGEVQVTALGEDHVGDLWVGSNSGLLRIDAKSGTVSMYHNHSGDARSLPGERVQAILEDSAQRLWVGTASGLALYDRQDNHFDTYRHDATDAETLPEDDVISLYEDRTNLLWVGTKTGGVAKWNSRSWSFGHHTAGAEGFEGADAAAFASDENGTLWIATMGRGLVAIDRHNGSITHLHHSARDPASLPDDRVMALLVDHEGTLWAGTMAAGLTRRERRTGQFTHYRHDAQDPDSLPAAGVMSLLEDSHGQIWVGTFGGGLGLLDRATGKFKRYAVDATNKASLSSDRVTALAEDRSGRIWVGTDGGGVCLLDPRSNKISRFPYNIDNPKSLSSNTVYAIRVDARDRVWIGTRDGGLDEVVGTALDPAAIGFRNYSERDGLPNTTIYGIETDASNRLWLSTNRGLSRFDPNNGEFRNFRRAHGLQADEFNFGAHYRSQTGELFFGGHGGYNAFVPEHLQFDQQPPAIVLTAFLKENEPAALELPPERLKRIDLGYRDDVVTFDFAALDFASPQDNHYRYMLEGFDKSWVDAGARHRMTYTNLNGGRYTFRVQAANSDGKWNQAGLTLPLTMQSPPWATPWAWSAYILLVCGGIFAMWSSQHRKLRREAHYSQRLEQDVRDRTQELAQRNEELEIVNRQIREVSLTDPLTGLGNRRSLREAMVHLTEAGSGTTANPGNAPVALAPFALLVVDLDHLKPINDQYGHDAGDRVLLQIAEILKHSCRNSDLIARWGGDEFVIVYKDADPGAAEVLAERIRSRVAKQIFRLADGKVTRTSCSIGFSRYPFVIEAPTLLTWEQSLAIADAALYQAKQQRNGWVGWVGTAATAQVDSVLKALERDPDQLEQDGQLEVRRPRIRPEDTVNELRLNARPQP